MVIERAALLVCAASLIGADCGGSAKCNASPPPPAMTEARARVLDPSLQTGLAVSTTTIFGDCRPTEVDLGVCGAEGPCRRERAALGVAVVPVNVSLPLSPRCEGGTAVADLLPSAAFDDRASALGELVAGIPAGLYTVHVWEDDGCAYCAQEGAEPCVVEVREGRVTTRDLVLDRSTR